HRALLDVQLDERVHALRFDARVLEPVGVEAGRPQRLGQARPVAVAEPVEVVAAELAGGHPAADAAGPEARLLARPDDDLDRASRPDAQTAHRAHRLDRAEHADDAVVAAGVEGRVDVRAGEHGRVAGVRARPAP